MVNQIQREILNVAKSYLNNTERLIYSYAGRTFYSAYDLYDSAYDNRGNIDCSTYMHLVMLGIDFDQSPYATGNIEDGLIRRSNWGKYDFLADLKENGPKRRAWGIAKHFYDEGKTFTDIKKLQPTDLVFYRAPEESLPFYKQHGAFMEIAHIGMASENTEYIYHSTGYPEKEQAEKEGINAIQYTHIHDGRSPILFARPEW